MGQIAKQVNELIDKKPIIKHCLAKGLINYSELSRQLQEELGVKNFQAVLIAVRRKAEALIKNKRKAELGIEPILKESSLDIKTKIVVMTLDLNALARLNDLTNTFSKEKAHFQAIQGTKHITLIIEEKYSKLAETHFKKYELIKTERKLAEVIIKSPASIEKTPGVASAILSEVSENGINIIETLSCYTDTILIIKEQDLTEIVRVLDRLLG